MKIHPVGAKLFNADRQTAMTKLSLFEILCMHLKTLH